jgi:hypothetical protein
MVGKMFGASRVLRHGEVHDKARALLSRSSFKQELPLRHRGALVNQGDVRPPRRWPVGVRCHENTMRQFLGESVTS